MLVRLVLMFCFLLAFISEGFVKLIVMLCFLFHFLLVFISEGFVDTSPMTGHKSIPVSRMLVKN